MFLKKNKLLSVILIVIIFLISSFAYLYFNIIKNKNKTQLAIKSTHNDSLFVNGIVVRSEDIINVDKNQNTIFSIKNATKVANGNVIAKTYDNINDINLLNKIDFIDKEINTLKYINALSNSLIKTDRISKTIYSDIKKLNTYINDENFIYITLNKNQIYKTLLEREKLANSNLDLNQRIEYLMNQKNNILSNLNSKHKSITANTSGYFVNYIDGYENIINNENYNNFSFEDIEKMLSDNENVNDYTKVGKIIKDYRWKYIFIIDNKSIKNLKIGSSINASFSSNQDELIPFNIIDIKQNGDKSLVVMECDYLTEDIVKVRKGEFELILKSYNGIKIDKNSLRIKDEKKGVYILENGERKFRKINIIFENQDYVISSLEFISDDEFEYLKLYDQILVN